MNDQVWYAGDFKEATKARIVIGLKGWLFLKRLRDKEHYDLAEVCRVRGRAVTAITESEIDAQRERLKAMGVKL